MTLTRPSAVALILANLVPLAGVLWLDWRVFDILMLYWAENVVIGVVNVLRMIACGARTDFRFLLIPFFIVHYGMFCFGHYTAVVRLFADEQDLASGNGHIFGVAPADVWQSPLWFGVVAIAISHLLSFYFNFLGRREYRRTNMMQLMRRPYGRIIVLHIAVIAGGFLIAVLGDPTWMLLVLIVMKSAIDLRMHEKERHLFAGPTETA